MNYAGFWRRAMAAFIDGMIMLIPSWILGLLLPYVGGLLVALLYKPIFEASSLKATPGKAMMDLMVVSENGEQLSLKQAYIRYFCSFLSAFVLCMGYLMNLFTAKRQTLHDMIAETVVINHKSENISYFQIWKHEIKSLYNKLSGEALAKTEDTNSMNKSSSMQSSSEISKAIEDLHRLYQSGAISQFDYETKKQELLKKI